MSEENISVALTVPCTEAEGPGRRFAVWLQGCPLRCPGCCNPEMLLFDDKKSRSIEGLAEEIRAAHAAHNLEGVTFLGGEPFAHEPSVVALIDRIPSELTIMVFSGFTLDALQQHPKNLLGRVDILVDGPYIREQPEPIRRWIGSANQKVHFLTSRVSDDDRWKKSDTLEIRLNKGQITVNGYPAVAAKRFLRPPHAKP